MARRATDLYGLPLQEFTKARDKLARDLRKAGKKEAADELKALRKPTVSAWMVNQLARRRPAEMQALVDAGDNLRKAQREAVSGGGPAALRDATRAHRGHLDDLTSIAREELGADGATLQRVAQTLRSASADKQASKALLEGMLMTDVEQAGFGPLLSAVPAGVRPKPQRTARAAPKAKPKPTPKAEAKPRPSPQLQARVREAKKQAGEERRAADRAERAAEQARKRAERAEQRARELEAKLRNP